MNTKQFETNRTIPAMISNLTKIFGITESQDLSDKSSVSSEISTAAYQETSETSSHDFETGELKVVVRISVEGVLVDVSAVSGVISL